MSRHVLITGRDRTQTRIKEAFGGVTVVSDAEAVRPGAIGSAIIWIEGMHLDWLRRVRATCPAWPAVVLSLSPQPAEGLSAFEAGAQGYCHVMSVPQMLRQVAVVVGHGGLWVGSELMQRVTQALARSAAPAITAHDQLTSLTQREREVALLVAKGAANKEIAQLLAVTPRTVKAHLGAIFSKLGVRDRLQLVLHLRDAGSLEPVPQANIRARH